MLYIDQDTFCHVNVESNIGKFRMFLVLSDTYAKCSINRCYAVYTVQSSMCSMRCTYSDSGAFEGAGALYHVHCAVCRVQ